jgi:serine kinase of HPr protein (carbohydrate metabolism regulator)
MKNNVHASCVAVGNKGVLLLGDSGTGKSDLALRLIDDGARLVADDRTDLWTEKGRLLARAPANLAGLIEVRGLGIVRLAYRKQVRIALAVQLGRAGARLPEAQFYTFTDADPVRLMTMDGREASAPAKIRLAIGLGGRGTFTETSK